MNGLQDDHRELDGIFAKNRQAWWDKDDPKYCKPVSGDFSRHQEALRDYLWFRLLQLWTLPVVCFLASFYSKNGVKLSGVFGFLDS